MSLLDGKYEILFQRDLSQRRTLFDATAPDGTAVRIVWFDLEPDQEVPFERYRRLLKRLRREGRAAVYDVVSRPGAHYVAWLPPQAGNGARKGELEPALAELLADHGYRPEDADARRRGGEWCLYGLAFDGAGAPLEPLPRPAARRPRRGTGAPPQWAVTGALAALLLAAAVALGAAAFDRLTPDRLVIVPPLLGADVNEAGRELARLGLQPRPQAVVSEDAAGAVLGLEPPPGAQLRPGREVRVSYALPPGQATAVEVPRLETLALAGEARAALREAGLELGRVARIPASRAAGLVIAQVPPAGAEAAVGSAVDVLVSSGPRPERTFVPDLVGLPLEEALALARLSGLAPDRIAVDEFPERGVAAGTVLSQSLPPYVPVERGRASLRLVAATGAPLARGGTPSLVGMTRERARVAAGRRPINWVEIRNGLLPAGVVDQSPPPGDPTGGPVTLLVNDPPAPPVAIPRPEVRAELNRPEPREVRWAWTIEPGIGWVQAEVRAVDSDGEERFVERRLVRGGQVLDGRWRTEEPGPVRFRLYLNDEPYAEDLVVP